jgi:hypothetical protein
MAPIGVPSLIVSAQIPAVAAQSASELQKSTHEPAEPPRQMRPGAHCPPPHGWPAPSVPAIWHVRVVDPATKVQASPAGQPHCGATSLHGVSEHVPPELLEDEDVVLVEELELAALLELEAAAPVPAPPVLAPVEDVIGPAPVPAPPAPGSNGAEPIAQAVVSVAVSRTRSGKRMGRPPQGADTLPYADHP